MYAEMHREVETVATYSDPHTLHEYLVQQSLPFWRRFPLGIIDSFADRVKSVTPPGEKPLVLNLGSGPAVPGTDSTLLRGKGLDVVCFDGSEEAVRLSREYRYEAYQGDFLELDFEPELFDGIWACRSLINLHRGLMRPALRQARQVLASHGVLNIGMLERVFRHERRARVTRIGGMNRYVAMYTENELGDMLTDSGFRVVKTQRHHTLNSNYIFLTSNKAA